MEGNLRNLRGDDIFLWNLHGVRTLVNMERENLSFTGKIDKYPLHIIWMITAYTKRCVPFFEVNI